MRLLTKDYFIKNKGLVLWGAVVWSGLAAFVGLSPRSFSYSLATLVVQALLCCPFTLRTQTGRLWWAAYGVLLACLAVVHFARLPHPLAWVGFALCALCGGVTVCLRWRPPDAAPAVPRLPRAEQTLAFLLRHERKTL